METPRRPESQAHGQGTRRPYEAPAVSWEEDFEPYVYSTCAKMPGQGATCAGTKSS
jgi:hypothetical protein